jgi:hypothetical protein
MNIDNLKLEKNYGIMLSGGLDSAVLLYLLISQNKQINIQPFTIDKSDGSMMHVDTVIEHFNKKFNLSIPKTIKVGDSSLHHRLQSKSAVKDIFEKYHIDILFNAINQNPEELSKLPGAPIRDKKSYDSRIIFPFVNLLKTDILKFMFDNNQEDLSLITHSCTEQQIGRCCKCWQCTERSWAFSTLGKPDPGNR